MTYIVISGTCVAWAKVFALTLDSCANEDNTVCLFRDINGQLGYSASVRGNMESVSARANLTENVW